MKVTIENTTKIVEVRLPSGAQVPARVWEGKTDTGIPVHCYITRIAVADSENQAQFEAELQSCRAPSAEVAAIPLRLIL